MRPGLVLLAAVAGIGAGQGAAAAPPEITAVRAERPPVLDGKLDDEVWRRAPAIDVFRQLRPEEGKPSSQRTEVRVAFDARALYVAIVAFDREPDEIVSALGRRDDFPESDWVAVLLDSQGDRRALHWFLVNAAGTMADGASIEGGGDTEWDGVWRVEVARRRDGWAAELEIPLATLRFSGARPPHFGIGFKRWLSRRKEESMWPFVPLNAPVFMPNLADVRGLDGVQPGLSLQLIPYVAASVQPSFQRGSLAPRDAASANVGFDAKYGIGGGLTLDATVNPDFAQVELDPAVINLSAFEVYFPERRAFFLEGVDIFQSAGQMLYTRRVGAAPAVPDPRNGGDIVEITPRARILGALKLTGSVRPGTAIGLLSAAVDETFAVEETAAGAQQRLLATPYTSYSVARIRQALGNASTVGGTVTHVARAADRPDALVAGVDFDLRGEGDYTLSGAVGASFTQACDPVLRPAFGGGCDPVGTSVRGGKTAGEVQVRGEVGYLGAELDLNDLGFLQHPLGTQNLWQNASAGLYRNRPLGPLDYTYLALVQGTSFDPTVGDARHGAPVTSNYVGFDGTLRFRGNAELGWFVQEHFPRYDDAETRGNPRVRIYHRPFQQFLFTRVRSDDTRAVWLQLRHLFTLERGTYTQTAGADFGVRIGGRFQLGGGVTYDGWYGRPRWVDDGPSGLPRFADLELRQLGLSLRGTFAFTRALTLQSFGQLLRSVQRYTAVRTLSDPDTLAPCAAGCADAALPASFDGDFTSVIVNTVLRWELRPGSALYLVYTHNSQVTPEELGRVADGEWAFRSALRGLGRVPADDVVAVKLTLLWSL